MAGIGSLSFLLAKFSVTLRAKRHQSGMGVGEMRGCLEALFMVNLSSRRRKLTMKAVGILTDWIAADVGKPDPFPE